MSAPDISDDLLSFANDAGLGLTADYDSAAAVIWTDPGGEIRFCVRASAEFGYVLTSAERTLPEQFELFGKSMVVIERHLFGVFGSAVRARRLLPRLIFPTSEKDLAAGYQLEDADCEGYRSLKDSEGLVAKARGRVSVSTLTKLSRLLSSTLADVQASFGDPDGRPLFMPR